MIAVLLIATLGVSINSLYCLCKGSAEVSFFDLPPNDCEKNTTAITALPSCCAKSLQKSCCKENDADSSKKPHNCTKRSKYFIKLHTPFFTPDFEFAKLEAPIAAILNSKKSIFTEFNFFYPEINLSQPNNKAPPPRPYGAALRSYLQSYLC